jgi:hypothetical protein
MKETTLQLRIQLYEEGADDQRLDCLIAPLLQDLRRSGAKSVDREEKKKIESGAKGDPFTIGALVLVAMPAVLPQIFAFLQNWLIEGRKIVVESPNGAKLQFVPDRRLSESELLALVKQLNQIQVPDNSNEDKES